MGKRQGSDRKTSYPDERMSMNSVGDLHGRVDFFGIETKRANKPIYQKLKVIQTWVFIQTLAIVLLTAYLILLTVWLAPFFPMNYDTNDEVDENTAAIAALQTNQTDTTNQVDANTEAIAELREWRERQTRAIARLNNAVSTLQSQVSDLDSEVQSLNATVIELQEEVNNNTIENQIQAARIQNLDARVTLLETTVGVPNGILPTGPPVPAFADDARSREMTESLLKRVSKLECSKELMKERIKKLDNDTQERFCNITKTIGDVYGKTMEVQRQTAALKNTVAVQGGEINGIVSRVGGLRTDLDDLNEKNTLEHQTFANDISGIESNYSAAIDQLRNHTKLLAETLSTTVEHQINESRQTRDRFTEQDNLRDLAAEKSRVMLEEEVGKLQCQIAELEETVQANFNTCKAEITNKTQAAIELTEGMIDSTKVQLEGLLQDTKNNISMKIMDVNATLSSKIGMLKSELGNETDDRELQYTHLCDRLEGVQQDADNKFVVVNRKIDGANKGIQNLSNTIDAMQRDEIKQEGRISGLNQEVQTQGLAFLQFKAEVNATQLDLRNQTWSLQEDVNAIKNDQKIVEIRTTNSEKRVNDVELELAGAILEAEVKHIRALAELHRDQTKIFAQTAYLNDAYAQLVAEFGGNPFIQTLVNNIQQLLPQSSSPKPLATNGPQFGNMGTTSVASDTGMTNGETAPVYSDDYEYAEHE